MFAGATLLVLLGGLCNIVQGQLTCSCQSSGGCDSVNRCQPNTNCIKENVALGKPTYISSYYTGNEGRSGPACLAVNGNRNHVVGIIPPSGVSPPGMNCVHTDEKRNDSLWSVDLGANFTVTNIAIYNRYNFQERLKNAEIYVDAERCSTIQTPNQLIINITCTHPVRGRNVTVKKESGVICFCELEVWVCIAGRYGPTCGEKCFGNCKNNETCDNYFGTCLKGCRDGLYGDFCNRTCGNCKNVACVQHTGVCPTGCEAGWQGRLCNIPCPPGFYGPGCNKTCGQCTAGNSKCSSTTGFCQDGCQAGYITSFCNETCAEGFHGDNCAYTCGNCAKGTCNPVNGVCPSGCLTGYKQPFCNETCADGYYGNDCNNSCGLCADGSPCHAESGVCSTGCQKGYQAPFCNATCSKGYHGDKCSLTCGHCAEGAACHHETGVCPSGCESGYQGPLCDVLKGACAEGFHGDNCAYTCGNCAKGTCNPVNGVCPSGCLTGYKQPFCNETCAEGYYGNDCNDSCGLCADRSPCYAESGVCSTGCQKGYQAPFCNATCSKGYHGDKCNLSCGHCAEGAACHHETGVCPSGCESGYQGPLCEVLKGADCTSMSGLIAGAVVGCVVTFAIGLLVGWLVWRPCALQRKGLKYPSDGAVKYVSDCTGNPTEENSSRLAIPQGSEGSTQTANVYEPLQNRRGNADASCAAYAGLEFKSRQRDDAATEVYVNTKCLKKS